MEKLKRLVSYARPLFGEEKREALLFKYWLQSSLEKWARTAKISAFMPFDAYFAKDQPLDILLSEFLSNFTETTDIGDVGRNLLVANSLVDSLHTLYDGNNVWPKNGDPTDSAHMRETSIDIFKALQKFDTERAMRWAALVLRDSSFSNGFLADPDSPFPVLLYRAVDEKAANTETHCEFYTSLYEWAVLHTDNEKVRALFPEFFIKRLEAIFGCDTSVQTFDILNSVFIKPRANALALTPIDALDYALAQEAEFFSNEKVFGEFADRLNSLTATKVARFVREMDGETKNLWRISETYVRAFSKALATPPLPTPVGGVVRKPAWDEGGALDAILGGAYA